MTGRSGIGVLVVGFSRVGALKKHAPLVSCRTKFRIFSRPMPTFNEYPQQIIRPNNNDKHTRVDK